MYMFSKDFGDFLTLKRIFSGVQYEMSLLIQCFLDGEWVDFQLTNLKFYQPYQQKVWKTFYDETNLIIQYPLISKL